MTERLRNRLRFIGRFVYYAALHRGFRHVMWVLAAEGTTWH